MKKSIALITILASLVAPIIAGTGIGLNIGQSYTYNLNKQLKASNQTNVGLEFQTKGGATFYIQNEQGTWQGTGSSDTLVTGTQTVNGLGIRIPVADSAGLNVMLGTATSSFEAATNFGVTDGIVAAATVSSTDAIADIGAFYERTYGDVTISGDVTYRQHGLSNHITYNTTKKITNKNGIKVGARVSYGF